MALLGKAALAMWWDVPVQQRAGVRALACPRALPGAPGHSRIPACVALDQCRRRRRLLRDVRAGGPRGPRVGALCRPPQCALALVDADDAAAPQYGAQPMPGAANPWRGHCPARIDDPPFAGGRQSGVAAARPWRTCGDRSAMRPGLVGLHVLRHEAPPLAVTTEQKIRGNADRVADWVLVACGYDTAALRDARGGGPRARPGSTLWEPRPARERHLYGLAYSATPADIR